ncbi:MAG: Sir2 silent information regulator family NAD-dependent deacetylase [Bacteroides sp.]|nr:Sir2 silent information regulator family NAD-dependent deacetylase [Bacteroides sp.]
MDYSHKIGRAKELIAHADAVLIGAGAGFSAAAGLHYSGPEFEHDFADFIRNYGITDLYTSSFYPFSTEEERWAYWARHIYTIRYKPEVLPLYQKLLQLVVDKDYFVITTNVDGQFRKAGFCPERLFEVQGDYGLNQCLCGCHDALYNNENLVRQMVATTHDCRIPSRLVPVCPRCGGRMEVHVRKDEYFVQDAAWHAAYKRYQQYVNNLETRKSVVLLELGVGFNTPTIIRYPFEIMAESYSNTTLIRINKSETTTFLDNNSRMLLLAKDANVLYLLV